MIVGVLTLRRREAPAMAGAQRMTIEEVVRKVLRDEHADVIRASVETIAREIMEAEVSELIGAELGERRPDDRATHRMQRCHGAPRTCGCACGAQSGYRNGGIGAVRPPAS